MANSDLKDAIALYRTPAADEFPAIESRPILNRIIKAAGTAFPRVRTTGYLTDIALPEKDGDIHFYIETKEGADKTGEPMMACEIQGIYKDGKEKNDSRQPHLFELHPVLSIGAIGEKPIDFLDRVIWPTGEDPEEKDKTFSATAAPPKALVIKEVNKRIQFQTPSKSMKRENYVHVDGFVRAPAKKHTAGLVFEFFETAQSQEPIHCFAVKGSPMFAKVETMKPGHYEVGGLCGLDLLALIDATPTWKVRMSPVLSLKKL